MTVLTASHKEQLAAEGYVVVDGVFDPPVDLAPLLAEYNAALDEIATELQANGVIRSTYADLPFEERLIQAYARTRSASHRPCWSLPTGKDH